jgi:hypothetical protein
VIWRIVRVLENHTVTYETWQTAQGLRDPVPRETIARP